MSVERNSRGRWIFLPERLLRTIVQLICRGLRTNAISVKRKRNSVMVRLDEVNRPLGRQRVWARLVFLSLCL